MARTILSIDWIEKVKSFPETGMGYHKVKILLKDGTSFSGYIFNSEIVEAPLPFHVSEIADILAS